jgi:hypothetical protein
VTTDTADSGHARLIGQVIPKRGTMMVRGYLALVGLAAALACRGGGPPEGERTASAYTTGNDSAARDQQVEGTGTGTQMETPSRVSGVLTILDQLKRQPDKKTLTALRGGVGTLESAMRDDLTRAGLADSGEFKALTDSIARDLGGGAGGLTDDPKPDQVARLDARIRRLIEVHQGMVGTARK